MAVYEERNNLKENVKSLINLKSIKLLSSWRKIIQKCVSRGVYLQFPLTAPCHKLPLQSVFLDIT
jgi:hypothetical protein